MTKPTHIAQDNSTLCGEEGHFETVPELSLTRRDEYCHDCLRQLDKLPEYEGETNTPTPLGSTLFQLRQDQRNRDTGYSQGMTIAGGYGND